MQVACRRCGALGERTNVSLLRVYIIIVSCLLFEVKLVDPICEVMELVNVGNTQCMLALCHFCEHHGPCVLFHTRLTADTDSPATTRKPSSPTSTVNCTVCGFFFKKVTITTQLKSCAYNVGMQPIWE